MGDEAADTILVGGAKVAGWLIGSSISGLRGLARSAQDRRLQQAAAAREEASETADDAHFLALATDFTRRWPQLEHGHAALAEALQRQGRYEQALAAVDRAVALGLDERQAHMLRADIYDDVGQPSQAILEFTALTSSPSRRDPARPRDRLHGNGRDPR